MTREPSFTNQQVNSIVVDTAKHDAFFIFHALRTKADELRARAGGAATPILNKSDFCDVKIPLPSLEHQRRGGEILCAYDDLIENCERRIRVLDEMARALYREWFVLFRCPAANIGSSADNNAAALPSGWQMRPLSTVGALIARGISPIYDELGPSVVINQKCIRDSRLDLGAARRQRKPIPGDKCLRRWDVLINSTGVGTLGRIAQVLEDPSEPTTVDTHVTIVRPGPGVDPVFLGIALLGMEDVFERQGVGATGQTELGRSAIGNTSLMIPSPAVQERFGQIVLPIRTELRNLERQISTLRPTRDLLLPRLPPAGSPS